MTNLLDTRIPVCIFAKPPEAPEVKTRLIPALGAHGAAELASAMLQDAWHTVSSCTGVRPVLATTRLGRFPILAAAADVGPQDIWLQGEGDLGQRIERILIRGLNDASAAMAVGADSPTLTAAHLQCALDGLVGHEAVLGPCPDGGFYLIALRRCMPGLLASLPWSTPETLRAVKQRLQAHGFSIAELQPLFDVDTPADLKELAHPNTGPATRAWVSRKSCESPSLFQR